MFILHCTFNVVVVVVLVAVLVVVVVVVSVVGSLLLERDSLQYEALYNSISAGYISVVSDLN